MNTCKDCIHYNVCCDWTSKEAIDSTDDAVNDGVCRVCDHYTPTADVVAVRHGTWYHGTENGAVYAKCSACGRKMNYSCYGYAYCSLCGAKMDGERREKNEG